MSLLGERPTLADAAVRGNLYLPPGRSPRGMTVDAAILAGGRARRLGGVHKALLDLKGLKGLTGLDGLGGRRIIDQQLAALAPLVAQVLVVVGDLEPYRALAGVRLVLDRLPGRGPLAGLDAALRASAADSLLVVGCDLPFLDGKLLALVRDHAPLAQAVVPLVAGRPQALHARYHRSALPAIESRLQRGELRLLPLLEDLKVVYLDEPELRAADPSLRGLTNVNTPEQLAEARAMFRTGPPT